MQRIPVMRPLLPVATKLKPYLERIDIERNYSNFGPLVGELEARLEAHFGLGAARVVTVSNATLGLALALAAQEPPHGSLCMMPAWTFVASAHAAVLAGMTPYFVDVDARSWALDVDIAEREIAHAPGPIGAVMPVAPFGAPLDIEAWDAFRRRHRLAVVIDAAAGFDALVPGDTPAVVSLHATKVIGVGEGGVVASCDADLIKNIRTRANFGFFGVREATLPATNAKLSEYHAAIGNAALDEWDTARAQWIEVAQTYRRLFGAANSVKFQDEFGESWVSSTGVARVSGPAHALAQKLDSQGIETRQWWGNGAHRHAATRSFPVSALGVTEDLAASTIALPFYRDLDVSDARRVAEAVLATAG